MSDLAYDPILAAFDAAQSDGYPVEEACEALEALRQQFQEATERLRWIEAYFIGGWPDDDDCTAIWKLAAGDPKTYAKFAARGQS